jgi:hypothetical protein
MRKIGPSVPGRNSNTSRRLTSPSNGQRAGPAYAGSAQAQLFCLCYSPSLSRGLKAVGAGEPFGFSPKDFNSLWKTLWKKHGFWASSTEFWRFTACFCEAKLDRA